MLPEPRKAEATSVASMKCRAVIASIIGATFVAISAGPSWAATGDDPITKTPPQLRIPVPSTLPRDDIGGGTNALGVRVRLSDSKDNDTIQLYGDFDSFSPTVNDSHAYDLARNVSDAFGVPRHSADVDQLYDDVFGQEDDGGDHSATDIAVSIDGRLTQEEGSEQSLTVPVRQLQRIARSYGYTELELGVCPAKVSVRYSSSRPADEVSKSEHCRWWYEPAATSDRAELTIGLKEHGDTSSYDRLVLALAISSLVSAVLVAVVVGLIKRKHFRYLNGATLGMCAGATVLSAFSWLVGGIVMGFLDRPFTDYVMAHDLGTGGSFVTRIAPAFLLSIPMLLAAVMFTRAKPPAGIDQPPAPSVSPYGVAGGGPYGPVPGPPPAPQTGYGWQGQQGYGPQNQQGQPVPQGYGQQAQQVPDAALPPWLAQAPPAGGPPVWQQPQAPQAPSQQPPVPPQGETGDQDEGDKPNWNPPA